MYRVRDREYVKPKAIKIAEIARTQSVSPPPLLCVRTAKNGARTASVRYSPGTALFYYIHVHHYYVVLFYSYRTYSRNE